MSLKIGRLVYLNSSKQDPCAMAYYDKYYKIIKKPSDGGFSLETLGSDNNIETPYWFPKEELVRAYYLGCFYKVGDRVEIRFGELTGTRGTVVDIKQDEEIYIPVVLDNYDYSNYVNKHHVLEYIQKVLGEKTEKLERHKITMPLIQEFDEIRKEIETIHGGRS